MEACSQLLPRLPCFHYATQRIARVNPQQVVHKRIFHDYWVQKNPNGQSMRIPILKARHHLGAMSSRGDRAENEDRFRVGIMNKLTGPEEREPFYFAVIDG
jgi:hypothetical protein